MKAWGVKVLEQLSVENQRLNKDREQLCPKQLCLKLLFPVWGFWRQWERVYARPFAICLEQSGKSCSWGSFARQSVKREGFISSETIALYKAKLFWEQITLSLPLHYLKQSNFSASPFVFLNAGHWIWANCDFWEAFSSKPQKQPFARMANVTQVKLLWIFSIN